jgi:hypothetical protein
MKKGAKKMIKEQTESADSIWYFEGSVKKGNWVQYEVQGRGVTLPCPFCDDMIEESAEELAGKFSLMHGKHLEGMR